MAYDISNNVTVEIAAGANASAVHGFNQLSVTEGSATAPEGMEKAVLYFDDRGNVSTCPPFKSRRTRHCAETPDNVIR